MNSFLEIVHKDLKILSIKNFYKQSLFDIVRVNNILEENHKLYYLNQLDHYSEAAYNYPIIKNNCDLFFVELVRSFTDICERIFKPYIVDVSIYRNIIWCYRSCGDDYSSVFHDHTRTATINGVYYHQTNVGDGISFCLKNNSFDNIFTYYVEENELLIFPDYVRHAPIKPSGNRIRYSLNMEIPTIKPYNSLYNFY